METGKSAMSSKLMWLGALTTVLGAAQTLDWINLLGSQRGGYVVAGIGVATMVLRAVTAQPITGVVKS